MALVNAVTFIIIKMLANFMGEGVASTIVQKGYGLWPLLAQRKICAVCH
jgi:hypothetical protein